MSIKNKKQNVYEEAVKTLLSKLDSTEKFVIDQAPEVCRQLIVERKVDLWMDLGWYGTLSIVLPIATYLLGKAAVADYEHYSDKPIVYGLLAFGTSFGSCFVLTLAYSSIQKLTLLKVAPKIYLINTIRNMFSKD